MGEIRLMHGLDFAPGLNFINVLHTAFTPADHRSVKKDS